MLPTTLKIAKPLNFETKLKEHVLKNYNSTVLTEEVKSFLVDLQQNRNVISKMGEIGSSVDLLKSNLVVVTGYINQIVIIKSKMTFGKESHSASIQFEWSDSLKGSKISTYNIYFEYYNCLYLLAQMHFLIAHNLEKDNPTERGEELLKEITKHYRHALAIFEAIKAEIPEKVQPKEIPNDLSQNYLSYCSVLCTISGQLNLIEVAEIRKTSPELISKLANGVSGLYGQAYNIANEAPASKYVDGDFKNFLLFSKYFFIAKMFFKLRDNKQKFFNEKGTEFGAIIIYQ